MIKHSLIVFLALMSYISYGQSQGVTNSQTKLRPNQLRWSPTDATLDSVYIIRADTSTGEPGWYLVTLSGGGGVQDTTLAGDVVGGLNSTFVRKINGVTVENITPQNREVLTYNGTQWTPDSIALEDLPQMNASRVLGRGSSSAGAVTQLTPSNGVKISGNYIESDLTAGTGINISGTTTLTVSNSAPDQTVTISGAAGTYPNFTVTPTAPGGSSGQVQYNNAGSFGALDSFTVSANPDRVGIGVPTPTARVDIQGSGSTSATNALRVRNSSGTNLLTVRNDGNIGIGTSTPEYNSDIRGSFGIVNSSNNGTVSDVIFFASTAYPTAYRNKIQSNVSASGSSKLIFSLASPPGPYTFVNPLTLFEGGIGIGVTTPLSGLHNAINTTASTPSMLLSGTGYSGGTATTTKPTLLIEPTGATSTGWSTSGTKLGVNAESGFTGLYFDFKLNGASKLSLDGSYLNFGTGIRPFFSGGVRTSGPFSIYNPSTITGNNYAGGIDSWTLNGGGGHNQDGWVISGTINQSSTAAYNGLNISLTETATGSGEKNLIKTQIGGVTKFKVSNTGQITSASDKINLAVSKTPSSASDTGTIGDICWDANYIYVCVGTNTWKRTAITTW